MSATKGDMPKSCGHHLYRRHLNLGFTPSKRFMCRVKVLPWKTCIHGREHSGLRYSRASAEKLEVFVLRILVRLGWGVLRLGSSRLWERDGPCAWSGPAPGDPAFPWLRFRILNFHRNWCSSRVMSQPSFPFKKRHSWRGQKVRGNIYSAGMRGTSSPVCVRVFAKLCSSEGLKTSL